MARRGPDGKLLSALTGVETDAELRALATQFTSACRVDEHPEGCPFCKLSHLYHRSSQDLLHNVSPSALVGLFELECEVRNRAASEPGAALAGESLGDPRATAAS